MKHGKCERKHFLRKWLNERKKDQLDNGKPVYPKTKAGGKLPKAGNIFLLPEGCTTSPALSYVAMLEAYNGVATCVPFSPYSVPASNHEWLTGLDTRPLRVLQIWNSTPAPIWLIEQGWYITTLSDGQLADALVLYECVQDCRGIPLHLQDRTGQPILKNDDPRLPYVGEQSKLYGKLRTALFK